MPEKSGFFDSTSDDIRAYPAREFAEYFARFVGNGIFGGGTKLKVTATGSDANLKIEVGYGWINGYLYGVYNDPLTLPIQPATTNDRIDRVILRLDTSTPVRAIRALILQGNPAVSPVVPALTRSGDIYDLSLAQILVKANSTVVKPENVTDERLNSAVCGVVTGLIQQADTTDIFNQFQAWLNTKTSEYQQEWKKFLESVQDEGFATTDYVNERVLTGGYGVTTNSGNAYSVTPVPAPNALVAGLRIIVKINAANTGSANLNVNGLGPKNILKSNGSNLNSGFLKTNSVYTLVYSGTAFILQGEGGEYGTAVAGDVRSTKTIGTDSGIISGSLITRNTAPTIINPNNNSQTLEAGIYDYPITVLGGVIMASGTATSSNTTMTPIFGTQHARYYITVNGLGFRPNRVILRFFGSGVGPGLATYDFATNNGTPTPGGTNYNFVFVGTELLNSPGSVFIRVYEFSLDALPTTGFAVSNSAFRLPIPLPNLLVSWEALKV